MDITGLKKPAKVVANAVAAYQKARVTFIDTMHNLASSNEECIIQSMLELDVLSLLWRPMLRDPVPNIQSAALNTVSKLVGRVDGLAASVVGSGAIEALLPAMWHDSRAVQRAANSALQSVVSADMECTEACVRGGALDAVYSQLENFDTDVTEAAVNTLCAILGTKQDLTAIAITEHAARCLIHLLESDRPTPNLKNMAAALLGNMCAQSCQLADCADRLGAFPALAELAADPSVPARVRATCLGSLSQAAAHSDELAEAVLAAGALSPALAALTDTSPGMCRSASELVRNIAQKSPTTAEAIERAGGIPCLVASIRMNQCNSTAVSSILSLGHLAAFHASFAQKIVTADGGRALTEVLVSDAELNPPTSPSGGATSVINADKAKGCAAWTLMQISLQGNELAQGLAHDGAISALLRVYQDPSASADLQHKSKKAMKAIIQRCDGLTSALEPLVLESMPPELLQHLLSVLARSLSIGPTMQTKKTSFVKSGALMRLQQIKKKCLLSPLNSEADVNLQADSSSIPDKRVDTGMHHRAIILRHVETICATFPPDVINYYFKP